MRTTDSICCPHCEECLDPAETTPILIGESTAISCPYCYKNYYAKRLGPWIYESSDEKIS